MKTILVVDDELGSAEVLSLILEEEGYKAYCAVNGRQALVQARDVVPDLVIVDYMMPLMNGGEMAQLVRAAPLHSKVPIVMTSATDEEQVEQHSEYYDAFLRKPYRWDDLFAIIRRLLASPKVN